MLLEKNRKQSSGEKTRHIEIQCHFITDNVRHGNAMVECCLTEDVIADYFTKPLQGRQFCQFRAFILNPPFDHADVSMPCTQERAGRNMIDVVSDRADEHTRWDLQLARTARRLQNIVMQPGKREPTDKIN